MDQTSDHDGLWLGLGVFYTVASAVFVAFMAWYDPLMQAGGLAGGLLLLLLVVGTWRLGEGLYCGDKSNDVRASLIRQYGYRWFVISAAFGHPDSEVRVVHQCVLLTVIDTVVGAMALVVLAYRIFSWPFGHVIAALGISLFLMALWLANDFLDRGYVDEKWLERADSPNRF